MSDDAEKPPRYTAKQISEWFRFNQKHAADALEKAPALFKRGEGIDEVPGGNDCVFEDEVPMADAPAPAATPKATPKG